MNIQAEANTAKKEPNQKPQTKKPNHYKLDHSNSLKILAWTQILFPPSFTSIDNNFTGEVIKT